jgi:hypothetical protein
MESGAKPAFALVLSQANRQAMTKCNFRIRACMLFTILIGRILTLLPFPLIRFPRPTKWGEGQAEGFSIFVAVSRCSHSHLNSDLAFDFSPTNSVGFFLRSLPYEFSGLLHFLWVIFEDFLGFCKPLSDRDLCKRALQVLRSLAPPITPLPLLTLDLHASSLRVLGVKRLSSLNSALCLHNS